MNLHLTGHHIQITPSIRDYVAAKLVRIHVETAPDRAKFHFA